jgi:hypothetical protein
MIVCFSKFLASYTILMQSLSDIMGDKDFGVPPEVVEIKAYVQRHFKVTVGITVQEHMIIITTRSAALAGSLRPHLHKLTKQLNTDKRLIIRIG